ncbi:MAG: hypothetical protein ACK56F_24565, partial [bacterium]
VSNSMLAGTHGFLDPHYSQTGQFDAAADGYAVGLSLPRAGYGVLLSRCCQSVSPPTLTQTHTMTRVRGNDANGAHCSRAV